MFTLLLNIVLFPSPSLIHSLLLLDLLVPIPIALTAALGDVSSSPSVLLLLPRTRLLICFRWLFRARSLPPPPRADDSVSCSMLTVQSSISPFSLFLYLLSGFSHRQFPPPPACLFYTFEIEFIAFFEFRSPPIQGHGPLSLDRSCS